MSRLAASCALGLAAILSVRLSSTAPPTCRDAQRCLSCAGLRTRWDARRLPKRREPLARRRFFGNPFGGQDSQESAGPAPVDPNTPFDGGQYAPTGFTEEGTRLEILRYPHPALRAPNTEVRVFDGRLKQLCNNLFQAMYEAGDGIGLAAPQVGVNLRLMVYNPDPSNSDEETVFVNPRIIDSARGLCVDQESCLSFPRLHGPVQRPAWIEVQADGWDGCPFTRTIRGFEARLFQHEYDHLDGVLYVDKLPEPSRVGIQPDLDFLVKDYINAGGSDPAP